MLSQIDQNAVDTEIAAVKCDLQRANSAYKTTGNHSYFVDACFKNTDIVIPLELGGAGNQRSE